MGTYKRLYFVAVGAALGALLGIPSSYLFQSAGIKALMSMGDYVVNFGDVWKTAEDGVGNTARITVLGCALVGVVAGGALFSLITAAQSKAPAPSQST
jgi:hypothetical protein